MPTQEERLTALEKATEAFQKEAAAHIKETDENTTIMLGVMRHQGQDIKKIFQRLETVEQDISQIKTTLGEHTMLLTQLATRLDEHTALFTQLATRLNEHTSLLAQILTRLPEP